MNKEPTPQPINVLFIAPSAYPLGGVQTWLDYLVDGIPKLSEKSAQSIKTSIALTSGEYHDAQKYLDVHPFERVHLIKNPTGLREGRLKAIEDFLTTLNPNIVLVINIADVYHAVNNLRLNKYSAIKVVTTLHGIHPGLIEDISRYHQCIDAVIVTNKLTRRLVIDKTPLEPARVLYAPYGVDKLPIQKSQDRNSFTVAYVGRIEEDQKRISDLKIILEELQESSPNTKILIAGNGPAKDMDSFNQWLSKQSNRNIHYLGTLSPDDLRTQVYDVCDTMILTSHWETGPIVAWEAFQYGISLVSSKYIGSTEEGSLIDGHNCLMFDIGDTKKAVELIMKTQSKSLRKQLAKESKKLIIEKYSTNISIRSWADHLTSIASNAPKPYHKLPKPYVDKSRALLILRMILGNRADRLYEHLHRLFKRKFSHQSAGGEWPHTHSSVDSKSNKLGGYIENSADSDESR